MWDCIAGRTVKHDTSEISAQGPTRKIGGSKLDSRKKVRSSTLRQKTKAQRQKKQWSWMIDLLVWVGDRLDGPYGWLIWVLDLFVVVWLWIILVTK